MLIYYIIAAILIAMIAIVWHSGRNRCHRHSFKINGKTNDKTTYRCTKCGYTIVTESQ